MVCERLLKRVVEEMNAGNNEVWVTTKMYTAGIDAWVKSQRRLLMRSGTHGGHIGGDQEGEGKEEGNISNGSANSTEGRPARSNAHNPSRPSHNAPQLHLHLQQSQQQPAACCPHRPPRDALHS